MSKWSANEAKTMSKALQRLNINKKNGQYRIKQTSGAQVNISEDLFEFIKKGYEHTNKLIGPKSIDNQIPRLKSGNPEDDEPEGDYDKDCVAHAIANYGDGNVSYDSSFAYIDTNYNSNGVPGSEMDSVVGHFLPNATNNNVPIYSDSLNNSILVIPNSWGEGHAVNANYYDANTSTIYYYDYQNDMHGQIDVSDAIKLYR